MCSSRNMKTRKPVIRWLMNAHWPDFPLYGIPTVLIGPPSAEPLSEARSAYWFARFARSLDAPLPPVPAAAPHRGRDDVQREERDEDGDRPQGDDEDPLRGRHATEPSEEGELRSSPRPACTA